LVYDLTKPSKLAAMTQQLTIDQTSGPMATGTVEFYESGTGFGFIQPDAGNGAFVHVSALARAEMPDLFEGQNVSFEVKVDKGSGKSFVLGIKLAHNA
jgi:cold shock protein